MNRAPSTTRSERAARVSTESQGAPTAYLVRGGDPSLVAQAAHDLVTALAGESDPALVVEEFGGPGADQLDVGAVIDACTTPPFLVDRRVVVVREAGQLMAADAERLAAYLKDPLATSTLVLVAGGGTIPVILVRAVGSAGTVLDTTVGTGRARSTWMAEHVRHGPVRMDGAAATLLAGHLGEDMGRLQGLLGTLAAAYGEGAAVSAEDLRPFLGTAGTVAPWDLTDAIDAGKTTTALTVLRRILGSGDSHPLAVLTILHRHYRLMLQLDGSGVRTAEQASELLGTKSSYPAKKALAQASRLGSSGIGRAVDLVARADLDVRGLTELSGDAVLEVLVARLARLAGTGR
ncbi:MAG: DNA polymerase III subunit delta [Acidimicrobiales bacterium]